MKLREAEAIMGLKELRQQVKDLEEHWQVYEYILCAFFKKNVKPEYPFCINLK